MKANNINNANLTLFQELRLVKNMRTIAGSQDFTDCLIQIGNESFAQTARLNDQDLLEILQDFLNIRTNLIERVFGDPSYLLNEGEREHICNRVILCSKNKECLGINNETIGEMPGELKVCKSIVTIVSEDPDPTPSTSLGYLHTN